MFENRFNWIFVPEMKRWQICLLLLGIGAALIAADVASDEDDDGIVIEEEKIVSHVKKILITLIVNWSERWFWFRKIQERLVKSSNLK